MARTIDRQSAGRAKASRPRRRLFNLANILTLSRFAAAPVMLALTLALAEPAAHPDAGWISAAAFILLLLTLFTDILDGWIARAYGSVTDFGKIMDPVADSTFFLTLLFGLSASPRFRDAFPVWLPILVLFREVAMQVLRRYAALRSRVLAAKISGKAKMFIQSIAVAGFFGLLCANDLRYWPQPEAALQQWLFWTGVLVVTVNLLSMIEYLREVPGLVKEWHGDPDVEAEKE